MFARTKTVIFFKKTSQMTRRERYYHIIKEFESTMPEVHSELKYDNPFQLLCAVMLSAQCTDKRVNLVTPHLFKTYPSATQLAGAKPEDVKKIISSISYPNAKSRHLVEMAKALVDNFNGEVPKSIDELMTLSGVGRKTANVVASIIFGNPVIAVDTHVFRVAHRLGLSDGKTPQEVEKDLEANIEEFLRGKAHHWLLLHGRYICKARKPLCKECVLKEYCEYYTLNGQIVP